MKPVPTSVTPGSAADSVMTVEVMKAIVEAASQPCFMCCSRIEGWWETRRQAIHGAQKRRDSRATPNVTGALAVLSSR